MLADACRQSGGEDVASAWCYNGMWRASRWINVISGKWYDASNAMEHGVAAGARRWALGSPSNNMAGACSGVALLEPSKITSTIVTKNGLGMAGRRGHLSNKIMSMVWLMTGGIWALMRHSGMANNGGRMSASTMASSKTAITMVAGASSSADGRRIRRNQL